MIKHSKSVSSAHQRKFGPIERIKITFAFAANTIRRTLFHPILLLWILIVASLSVFALFHFDTIVADATNNTLLLRDVTLIIAALFALPLALSRTLTSERALLNERYQKVSEMLGSEISMVRLAAVYALKRLSHERSEDYHVDVVKLLCSFVRMRTAKEKSKNGTPVPPGKPAKFLAKGGPTSGELVRSSHSGCARMQPDRRSTPGGRSPSSAVRYLATRHPKTKCQSVQVFGTAPSPPKSDPI